MFKKLRNLGLFIKIGRFITRLADLQELVQDTNIKEVLEKVSQELEGKRIKITKENVGAFTYVIKVIAMMGGIVAFKDFLEAIQEDDEADLLLAARMVGLAGHACDLAVEYAKVREQFGQPIGSFQAVKHHCADMGVRTRLSWYQTNLACLKLQANAEDAPLQVASAKLLAAQAARENGRTGIQVHGGIGYQSECDAHWFVKRAYIYDQAGGNMAIQAKRVLDAAAPVW